MRRSRLLFAATLGFAAALGVFYEDHNVGFTILYAMGTLLLVALVTILAAPLAVRVCERADQNAVFKGETITYRLSVMNRSPFLYPIKTLSLANADVAEYAAEAPFALLGSAPGAPARHDADTAELEARSSLGAILPLRRREWEASLCFPYRGEYRVGIERLVVTDFLGLFSRMIRVGAPVSALVYPLADESFRVAIEEEPESVSRRHSLRSEDYSSVADVRKYASSDSLRKIHWQLSAARGELIVKNFASREQDRVVLFLDTGRLPLPGMSAKERAAFEDKMTGCVAAAVAYCAEARLPVELDFGGRAAEETKAIPGKERFPLRKLFRPRKAADAPRPAGEELFAGGMNGGVPEAPDALESSVRLAGVAFDRERSPVPVLDGADGPRDILLFLHAMDERARDAVAELVAAGHRVALYLFASTLMPLTDEARRRMEDLSAYGVAVHTVDAGEGGERSL